MRLAAISTAVMGLIIIFDEVSWLYRLRMYGPKAEYVLVDEKPRLVPRIKSKEELEWYRANQLFVPATATIFGQLTGFFPYLFIPIISWKCFWHFWVIYHNDSVLRELGIGQYTTFRILEREKW